MEILVGTTKGLFVLEEGRVAGPFCEGWPINHAIGRGREILAAGGSGLHGTGLPERDCFFTVLRQGMASCEGGVAFGTNSGSVFLSRDEGETWEAVAKHLPTVLSVEFMG